MTDEDLIESVPHQRSAWRRRADLALRRPGAAVAFLMVGLVIGAMGGFIVGYSNPQERAGLGYFYLPFELTGPDALGDDPFGQTYGRTDLPMLTREDLAALGEQVTREYGVLSAQSAVPVLCETSLGQPGSTTVGYPSKVFGVLGGRIAELVWSHPDAAAASTTLHTLVFQAQLCPDLSTTAASIRSSGVLIGMGDEYVIFTQQPTTDGPDAVFATSALIRLGADLIEVAFASDGVAAPDAELRCLRAAAVAVQKAAEG